MGIISHDRLKREERLRERLENNQVFVAFELELIMATVLDIKSILI